MAPQYPRQDQRVGRSNRENGTPMKPPADFSTGGMLNQMRSYTSPGTMVSVPSDYSPSLQQDRAAFQGMVQQARAGQQNLAVTGDSIGSPTNFSTGVMADRTNAAGAALQRLRDPNGFRNVQSSYMDPNAYATEQNLRINQARMAAEMAQRTAQYDAGTAKFTDKKNADLNGNGIPDRDEGISEQFGKYGISSMSDLSQVNAQYNAYMRAFRQEKPSGQRAMSFDEFVKTKHDQYKQLPAYGAAPQSPGTKATQQPQGGDLQRIIQTGNAAARTAQQQRNQSPGMMARAQDAMDQGAAMRAAAAASARGMDPRAAAAETLQNIAAMRAQAAQQGMVMDRLVQSGVNDLARVEAGNAGQMSLEALRQAGLNTQRQDARSMDVAKLGMEMMGEMQPLEQLYQATVQNNLTQIKSDPALLRRYPSAAEQLAAARQMAEPTVRNAAATQQARLAMYRNLGGKTDGFDQFINVPSFPAATTQGDAMAAQQPQANDTVQPTSLEQVRSMQIEPRPTGASDVANEIRNMRANNMPIDPWTVEQALNAQGMSLKDPMVIEQLWQYADDANPNNTDVASLVKQITDYNPRSWKDWATAGVGGAMSNLGLLRAPGVGAVTHPWAEGGTFRTREGITKSIDKYKKK